MRVRDLASVIFGHGKHGTMIAINFYYDGSGKDSDSLLTVGGYSASDITCKGLERDWLRLTRGRVFHLADFGTKSCELGSGGWSPSKQKAFLESLAEVISRDDLNLITMTISAKEFRVFLEGYQHRVVFGTPYSACAQAVVSLGDTLLDLSGMSFLDIAYVFEHGDRKHEILKLFDEIKSRPKFAERRSISFLPKRTVLLQPADFIAGTIQKLAAASNTQLLEVDLPPLFLPVIT